MPEESATLSCVRILPVHQRPQLLLASTSPRRRQLLALGNWTFHVIEVNVDESRQNFEEPDQYVLRLAETKARSAAVNANDRKIVLAADTAVVDGGDILGKPGDSAEASAMLRRLCGHTHQVYTAIAVLGPAAGDHSSETSHPVLVSTAPRPMMNKINNQPTLITDLCVTDVPMRNYSDEEIARYVESGDPLDKAGAYAIQYADFNPVAVMRGCFASVMGLPLCHVLRCLRILGFREDDSIASACQKFLAYRCPVSDEILNVKQTY